jgi:rhamnosyltransferase
LNKHFDVLIRNRNEAKALGNILNILRKIYSSDIGEIIVVDNNSTDNSIEIAERYNCKVIKIGNFSYGRAINYGMGVSTSKYVLVLSAHAIPVGKDFFSNTFLALNKNENVAGARFINSIDNYNRALRNNFKVNNPLKFGLMAACCIVNKDIWNRFKFDENLIANEDKEWSKRVMNNGFEILDINETYFYFIKRNSDSILNRYKNETIAECLLLNKEYHSPLRSLASFFKKIFITNTLWYFKVVYYDILRLEAKIQIYNQTKRNE